MMSFRSLSHASASYSCHIIVTQSELIGGSTRLWLSMSITDSKAELIRTRTSVNLKLCSPSAMSSRQGYSGKLTQNNSSLCKCVYAM